MGAPARAATGVQPPPPLLPLLLAVVALVPRVARATGGFPCDAETEWVSTSWREPEEPECHSCYECVVGQVCLRRGGCSNCTAGEHDDDGDPTTVCAACPEGKTSGEAAGATGCHEIEQEFGAWALDTWNELDLELQLLIGASLSALVAACGVWMCRRCEGGIDGLCAELEDALCGMSDAEKAALIEAEMRKAVAQIEAEAKLKAAAAHARGLDRAARISVGTPVSAASAPKTPRLSPGLMGSDEENPPEALPLVPTTSAVTMADEDEDSTPGGLRARICCCCKKHQPYYRLGENDDGSERSPPPSPCPAFSVQSEPELEQEPEPPAPPKTVYCRITLQAPPQALSCGDTNSREVLNRRLDDLANWLELAESQWTTKKRFPVCISNSTVSSCDLREELRRGSIHCLIWCARGAGWEARTVTDSLTTLDDVVQEVRRRPNAAPSIAVVCLQYGARKAAMRLKKAGVTNVMWLTADMLGEGCADIVCKVIAPAVSHLEQGRQPSEVSKELRSTLHGLADDHPSIALAHDGSCGCEAIGPVAAWVPPETDSTDWLQICTPAAVRVPESMPTLNLHACDLECLPIVRNMLRASKPPKVSIVSKGDQFGSDRRRSIARDVCIQYSHAGKHSVRVSSAKDLDDITPQTRLVWLDLLGSNSAGDIDRYRTVAFPPQAHVLLTCDDILARLPSVPDDELVESDRARLNAMAELGEELEELDIGQQAGLPGVYAHELHDEFKLLVTLRKDPVCLFEVFEDMQVLASAIQRQLQGPSSSSASTEEAARRPPPVVAIFQADEEAGLLFRVCVSDVAFLHMLRDRLLSGDFSRDLQKALQSEEGICDIEIKVDTTHFAEIYEHSILCLDKLTPHQQANLKEIRAMSLHEQQNRGVHIMAPAGAGKTFLALHFMLDVLMERADSQILFVARNQPLALFVIKWVIEREIVKGTKKRNRLVSRIHLLHEPFKQGPCVAQLAGCTLDVKPVSDKQEYELIVIDEAHHIWNERLQEHLKPHLSQSCGGKPRMMMLSDVSQGLHSSMSFPHNMIEVHLNEVVRSSKRVVSAAMRFQLDQQKTLLTRVPCHNGSEGPPLRSFVFDITDDESKQYEQYAKQTFKALRSVATSFSGLNLHTRLAIIVPTLEFRNQLSPLLQCFLDVEYAKQLQLVDATTVSRECIVGGRSVSSSRQLITLDAIDQVDGMEFLIVVCVGLDSLKQDSDLTFEGRQYQRLSPGVLTRSRLYRGFTRAHMLVLAVNEFIPHGFLEYLTEIRLVEDRKFDEDQTLRANAELKENQASDAKRFEKAAKETRDWRDKAEHALPTEGLGVEETEFCLREAVELMRLKRSVKDAVAEARTRWRVKSAVKSAIERRAASAKIIASEDHPDIIATIEQKVAAAMESEIPSEDLAGTVRTMLEEEWEQAVQRVQRVPQELKDSQQVVQEAKSRKQEVHGGTSQSVWDPSENESYTAALRNALGALFDKFDTNEDGLLSEEEGARLVQFYNSDGDVPISKQDIAYQWDDIKKGADINEDGQVSRNELIDYVWKDPCRENEDAGKDAERLFKRLAETKLQRSRSGNRTEKQEQQSMGLQLHDESDESDLPDSEDSEESRSPHSQDEIMEDVD